MSRSKAEQREYSRKYRLRPEQKEYSRQYRLRPEAIARRRERQQTPEYKEKQRTKAERWRKDPVVVERHASNEWKTQRRAYRHGLTMERYLEILKSQDFKCASCRTPFTQTPQIDHDHQCCPGPGSCGGCVRGLVCKWCNAAAGVLESPRKQMVEEYLSRWKTKA